MNFTGFIIDLCMIAGDRDAAKTLFGTVGTDMAAA
jgi:hypothetical protein